MSSPENFSIILFLCFIIFNKFSLTALKNIFLYKKMLHFEKLNFSWISKYDNILGNILSFEYIHIITILITPMKNKTTNKHIYIPEI
jgi:hypothetical protein